MSCGPVGLDAREYYYGYFDYRIPGGAAPTDVYTFNAQHSWLVTRIRYWAGAAGGSIGIEPDGVTQSPIAADGCLCLEPNGAYRGNIFASGAGAVVIVEYWFQVNEQGTGPNVVVTV